MLSTRHFRSLALLLIVGLLVGCGGGPGISSGPAVTTVDTAKLPKVDTNGYMLDDDQLEVFAPEGWRRGSRTERAMAKFHANNSNNPIVYIHVDASTNPVNLTEDGAAAFQQQIVSELNAEKIKPASPIRIVKAGGKMGVYYTRIGRDKDGAKIERFYVITIANGKRYTLEMIAKKMDYTGSINHVWAILNGMKYGKAAPDEQPADTPAIEVPAEDTPAEDAPAEDAPAEDAADAPAEE